MRVLVVDARAIHHKKKDRPKCLRNCMQVFNEECSGFKDQKKFKTRTRGDGSKCLLLTCGLLHFGDCYDLSEPEMSAGRTTGLVTQTDWFNG